MTEVNKLLTFCRGLSEFTDAELVELDRAGLSALHADLRRLASEIDAALARLAFLDDHRVN